MKNIKIDKNNVLLTCFVATLWINVAINKTIEAVILSVFALIVLYVNKLKVDIIEKGFLFFVIVSVVSWIKAVFFNDATLERIIAALILIIMWFVATILYDLARRNKMAIREIAKWFFVNYVIWIASVVLFLGLKYLNIPNDIYIMEYGRARFVGFFEYSTLNVAFAVTHASVASYYIWEKTKSKFFTILCYMIQWLPLYFTYSRSGYVLVAAQMMCYVCYFLLKKLSEKKIVKKGISIVCLSFIPLLPVLAYIVLKIFNRLMGLREGSNLSRYWIYRETIAKFIENPLIGNGIKTPSSLGYPLGSHCSYLGFFYRTGIIGGVVVIATLLIAIVLIWKKRKLDDVMWFSFFLNLLILLAYAIFEDIDGEYWLLCMFFFYMGTLRNDVIFDKSNIT